MGQATATLTTAEGRAQGYRYQERTHPDALLEPGVTDRELRQRLHAARLDDAAFIIEIAQQDRESFPLLAWINLQARQHLGDMPPYFGLFDYGNVTEQPMLVWLKPERPASLEGQT